MGAIVMAVYSTFFFNMVHDQFLKAKFSLIARTQLL